ncbi:MAG: hypothetical protein LUO93_05670 [Methanomicrobiales archaeon]|nr:hypothetical protein [Methanomicrobiales archaeon]
MANIKQKKNQAKIPAIKQRTTSLSENRYFLWAVFFAFLLCAVSATTYKIEDDDFFWHLSSGRFIAQNGYVPDKDVLGYTSGNTEWIPFEWGWDVMSYGLYSAGGYSLVYILRSLIFAVILFLIFRLLVKFKVNSFIIILLLTALLFALLNRLSPRPHLFSYLFFTFLLYFLLNLKYFQRDKYSKFLYLLPVIFLFWGNLHLGALMGILLLFVFIVSEAVIYFKNIKHSDNNVLPLTSSQLKKLAIIFICSLIVLLVNPHSIRTYIYAYEHTNMKMLESIAEWLSPFSSKAEPGIVLTLYKIFLFSGVIVLLYVYKKRDLTMFLIFAVFTLYSLRAIRFTIDYELLAVPMLAVSIDYFFKRFDKSGWLKFLYGNPVKAVLAAVLLFLAYQFQQDSFYITIKYNREAGLGISERYFPVEMVKFIKENQITGTPFNNFDTGGYLAWEVNNQKIFIDSRNLNDELFDEYISILNMQPGYKEKLNKYGVDYAYLFEPRLIRFPQMMRQCVTEYLFNDNNWALVYWDDETMLFLKKIPGFTEVISKYEYKVFNPYTAIFDQKKFEQNIVNNYPEAQKEIRRKVSTEPSGYFFQGMNDIAQRILRNKNP